MSRNSPVISAQSFEDLFLNTIPGDRIYLTIIGVKYNADLFFCYLL